MSYTRIKAFGRRAVRRFNDDSNASLIECERLRAKLAMAEQLLDQERRDLADCVQARKEGRLVITDYPYDPHSRAIEHGAAGGQLASHFEAAEDRVAATLRGVARHLDALMRIPRLESEPGQPFWANDWFPPLDGACLYGLLAESAPRRYIEVGSGMSTRFARRAIQDRGLRTRVVSIDPHPRSEIDALCDEVVRVKMEEVSRSFWEGIGPGDVLFVDNSHRSFSNSDVTVFFTEVLPGLPPGVVWGLHDIFLPWDYPEEWRDRFYNEQYLLLTYLLGGGGNDEIVLPARWVGSVPRLHDLLAPLWARRDLLEGVGTQGGCFWMRRVEEAGS